MSSRGGEQEASVAVVAGVLAFLLGAPWWLAIVSGLAIEVVALVWMRARGAGARTGGPDAGPDPRVGHAPTLHDWTARGPWGDVPR